MVPGLPNRLVGKNAVVVHVGSGLGEATAIRFAEEGAHVVVVDPLDYVADAVKNEIESRGGTSTAVCAPFGDEKAIRAVVERCGQLFDSLDVLMVAAGAIDDWPAEETSMTHWESIFRVDLLTPVFYTLLFRPLLARSGAASVIFYGSIDGIRGNPRIPAYSAARGALIPFVHTAAHTLGPEGIRVNLIAGGAIYPLGPEADHVPRDKGDPEVSLRETPLGRTADPADIAGVASFLACADSGFMTGAVLTLDGGRTTITPGTGLHLA